MNDYKPNVLVSILRYDPTNNLNNNILLDCRNWLTSLIADKDCQWVDQSGGRAVFQGKEEYLVLKLAKLEYYRDRLAKYNKVNKTGYHLELRFCPDPGLGIMLPEEILKMISERNVRRAKGENK